MSPFYLKSSYKVFCSISFLIVVLVGISSRAWSQNCPANTPATVTTNPNTYYPGTDTILNAGATSVTLGAASGTTAITSGDLLLLIQMQGSQINSTNTTSYGDGVAGGSSSGYLSNSALMAGNMEYVVAAGAVSLSGGVLPLLSGTIKKYKNAGFGTNGQYQYQIIRVAIYYNCTFGANITATPWNGTSGGVLVINVTNSLNFNGKTLSAAAAGFRGGAARQLSGGSGGANTDLVTLSTQNYNGSKGEGIAGTPRYVNNNGTSLDNGSGNEGYPNGSYAAGAPGNAGGGGTDGKPTSNDQNSGGGGGGNGGPGGRGGNSWSSNLATGGEPGALFQENSPARLIMGGGGGAGTTNNGTGASVLGFSSSGAAGGGIVLLTAVAITGTGTIDVSGDNGNLTVLNDGSGGGGAGGSVLLYAGSGLSGITVTANGGTGGTNTGTGSAHGPGGGGGGGIIYSNGTLNTPSSANAGTAGYTALLNHYGAAAGNTGVVIQNITKDQTPPQFLYCSLLPVIFESVAAAWQQNNVLVKWRVSNELAVKNYTVERSTDGNSFTYIAVINYTNNATALANSYSYTDTKTAGGIGNFYYRIKALSDNGNVVYSSIVTIKDDASGKRQLMVSPNPVANGSMTVGLPGQQTNGTIYLRLVSLAGTTVWQKQTAVTAGTDVVAIHNMEQVPDGNYFLQYYNGTASLVTKIMIRH